MRNIDYDKLIFQSYDIALDINRDACVALTNMPEETPLFQMRVPMIFWKQVHLMYPQILEWSWEEFDHQIPYNKQDEPGIYFITDLNNDKTYVGQSVNMWSRCRQHFMDSDPTDIFDDYWNKKHIFAINFVPCDRKDLDMMEQRFIEEFDCVKSGYNKV